MVVVLEEDGGVFAGLLDDFGVGVDVLRGDFVLGLAVEVAEVDDLIEDAAGGAGDGCFIHAAVFERGGHFFGIELDAEVAAAFTSARGLLGNVAAEHGCVHLRGLLGIDVQRRRWRQGVKERGDESAHRAGLAAGHFHVESGVDEVDGVDRAPIGGDEAFEADLVAEDFGEGGLVAAGEGAVEAVVGAHDGGDVGAVDGGIEWRDVDLVQGLVVDKGAAAVGVVADEVLDLRHDVLRLDALDFADAHFAGEERVFAEGVVAAAELEVAVDVDEGLQGDVDAEGAVFAADDDAIHLRRLCG